VTTRTSVIKLTLVSLSLVVASRASSASPPKNIIIMTSDGCGYNHVEAASLYQYGRVAAQPYERFGVKLAMSTYGFGGSYEPQKAWSDFKYVTRGKTDSAAAATAMATGVKTYNGAIGVNANKGRVENLIERCEELGKATGVVTSVPWAHATPAGFVAHDTDRDNYEQISAKMIASGVEVDEAFFRPGKSGDSANANKQGLAGLICESEDFDEPGARDIIRKIDFDWTGGPSDWSGYWQGYIEGPFTGKVTFTAKVDNGIRLDINGETVIDGLARGLAREDTFSMVKEKKYHIRVWYTQDGDPSYLHLYWSWTGQSKVLVPESAFSYSPEDMKYIVQRLPGEYWDEQEAPIIYDGSGREKLDLSYQHGRLALVVGTENYQLYRGNREHPEFAGELDYTYHHAPMLAYWKGKFYLEFLSAPVNEHDEATVTSLTTSIDARNWSTPKVIFPSFKPQGDSHEIITHQRMGFYVSPDKERLLVLAFYGRWPSPNEGQGIGRVVREVHEDGSLGPIYFIRYNRHAGWKESNTPYPFYKESPDKSFVKLCETLMENKLYVQQWYEEDRSKDGFYALEGEGFKIKAFNWYTRKDGKIAGLWKDNYASLSNDAGRSWLESKKLPSIITGTAKVWAQQTEDGRYAFVYNPHYEWRFPLVLITGADGRHFGKMACIHGEVPPIRYEGDAKDPGPQYIRGITPGNGEPPGDEMWLVYSMNKEDIWISRVTVPIRDSVNEWVDDNFDDMIPGGPVDNWNIYQPKWAPIDIVEYPSVVDKSLRISDKERYDYARAVRVFPKSGKAIISFEIQAKQSDTGRMEIDVLSRDGRRPVSIALNETGKIVAVDGGKSKTVSSYQAGRWISFNVNVDAEKNKYSLAVDGRKLLKNAAFAEQASTVERISFRTGKYRRLGLGSDREGDLPKAGEPVPQAIYHINDVKINPL